LRLPQRVYDRIVKKRGKKREGKERGKRKGGRGGERREGMRGVMYEHRSNAQQVTKDCPRIIKPLGK
jgi:hypothetical protein